MKIEFNGRAVAGFFLGAFCGAVAAVVAVSGPVGRIQVGPPPLNRSREAGKGRDHTTMTYDLRGPLPTYRRERGVFFVP